MPERFGGGATYCQPMQTVRLSNALGDVNDEALASTAAGNGVVAWFDDAQGDGSYSLRSIDWHDGCRTTSATLALPAGEGEFELALAMNDQRAVALWDQTDEAGTHIVMSSQHVLGGGWTQPIALTRPEDSTLPITCMCPLVAMASDGSAIAAWFQEGMGSADQLVTATTSAGGSGWATSGPISTAGSEPSSWSVGIDRHDNPVVSWVEYSIPDGTSARLKAAWGSGGLPALTHLQTIASFGPGALAYAPRVAVGAGGEATIMYYADTAGIGSPVAVFATTRPTPADSFQPPKRLSGSGDNSTPGEQTVAIDATDHAFAAWNAEGAGSALRYRDRLPFPASWGKERTLASGAAFADATFAPGGALAVAFTQSVSGPGGEAVQLVLRPPGHAFGQPLRLSVDGTDNPIYPLVGLDRRGRALVAWEQEGPNGARNQVWAVSGTPGTVGAGPLENNSWSATHPNVNPSASGPLQLPSYEVDFDACASNPDQVPGVTYQLSWTGTAFEAGAPQTGSTGVGSDCQIRVPRFGPQGTYTVTLSVTDPSTGTTTATVPVTVRDYLIVSIGDSYGAGEGAPNVPQIRPNGSTGPVQWARSSPADPNAAADDQEANGDNCDRSTNAPGAVVARTLEDRDPHSSVTFIHLACTGAEVIGPDHETGGLLSNYSPQHNGVFPPQVARLEQLVCDRPITVDLSRQDPCPPGTPERPIDALIVSIGGNDSGFGDRIVDCLVIWNCEAPETALAEKTWPNLRYKYGELGDAIAQRLPVRPQDVYLVEYAGATENEDGHYANLPGLLGPLSPPPLIGSRWGVDAREARWADEYFRRTLDEIGSETATQFQWTRVAGIVPEFTRHGIPADGGCTTIPEVPCLRYRTFPSAPHRWVNSLEDSFLIEGDKMGAVHPNATGYAHYASHILGALQLPAAPSRRLAKATFLAPVGAPGTVLPKVGSIDATADCSAACRIKATLVTGPAARLPLASSGAVLGTATAASAFPRGVRIRVRLNARARRLVRRLRPGTALTAHLVSVIHATGTDQTYTANSPITFMLPRRRPPLAAAALVGKTTRAALRSGRYLVLVDCQQACRVGATVTTRHGRRTVRLGGVRRTLQSGPALLALKPTPAGRGLLRAHRRVLAQARVGVRVGRRRVVLVSQRVVIRP